MANRPIYHKTCVVCGKEFTAKKIHAQCCSAKCRVIKSEQKRSKGGKVYKSTPVFEQIDRMIDGPDIKKGQTTFICESIIKHILRTDNPPDTFSTGKHFFEKRTDGGYPRYVTTK